MPFSCMGAHRGRWRLAVGYGGETVRKPQWRVTDGHDEFSDSLGGCCKMESLFHIELLGKTCYTMDRRKGA